VGLLGLLLALNLPAAWWRVFAEESDAAARESAAQLEKSGWKAADDEACKQLLDQGTAAVDLDPGNALYRYRLGVYRWRCVVRGRTKDEIGTVPLPEFRDVAEQIVTDMIVGSSMCPTMGALHCWRGQMEWWVLGREEGRQRVEDGLRTAQNDPVAWSAAGQLAITEGKLELALERFQRAVRLRKAMLPLAAQVLAKDYNHPELALALPGEDPQQLYDLFTMLHQWGFTAEADQARDKCILAYRGRLDEPGTPAWAVGLVADAASRAARHDEAAALYRQALAKDYRNLSFRLACVRELMAAGDLDEAWREQQICERIKPDSREVMDLSEKVWVARHPATTQSTATTEPATRPAPANP
jgi:tetratricopeptide (TPR) repeat protein